jgi:hypothetical protein
MVERGKASETLKFDSELTLLVALEYLITSSSLKASVLTQFISCSNLIGQFSQYGDCVTGWTTRKFEFSS